MKNRKPHDIYSLLDALDDCLNSYTARRRRMHEGVSKYFAGIEKKFADLECVQTLQKRIRNEAERYLVYAVCNAHANDESSKALNFLEEFGAKPSEAQAIVESIIDGNGDLAKEDIVRMVGGDMADDAEAVLTDFGKRLMFGEDAQMRSKKRFNCRNTIRHEKINEKTLYYSDGNRRQIETLESYLIEENFLVLQKRLKEKGMGQGFCCLFYGAPGTGKTETAYQIARKTGRDIFKVDISQIRNMFVGMGEKNMKRVFDGYASLCRQSEINGGKKNPGESSIKAAARELREETCIKAPESELKLFCKLRLLFFNYDAFALNMKNIDAEVRLNWENSEARWFDIDEAIAIDSQLAVFMKSELEKLKRELSTDIPSRN